MVNNYIKILEGTAEQVKLLLEAEEYSQGQKIIVYDNKVLLIREDNLRNNKPEAEVLPTEMMVEETTETETTTGGTE